MKKNSIIKLALLITLTALSSMVNAQQIAQKHVVETDYLLYLPDGYNAADTITKWPLMMFLHGAGETGNDIEKVKGHGPAKLIEQGKKFPFIVVSPQTRNYGWKSEQLMDLLASLISKYNIDKDRLYLTGLSMGGYGTWKLAADYPNVFAAIIPICGGGNPDTAYRLRHMPIWCFHGAKDDVVPLSQSEQMIDAVKKYNKEVQLTVYPEANHDSWTETYANDAIYDWLLQYKQEGYKEVPVDSSILEEYVGRYADEYGEIYEIVFEDNKLYLKMGNRAFRPQLKPASETEFFVYERHPNSCIFERNTKGDVEGIYFYSERSVYYKRIE